MAASHHNGILARKVAPLVFEGFASGVNAQAQALSESVTQLLATKCRSFHTGSVLATLWSNDSSARRTVNASLQHQQCRSKVTNKTTTKSQRFSLHIPPQREAEIRRFWTEARGVHDLACLHRLANFARIYPRYRDLRWLDVFMPQWDSAIERLIAHDMGMFPANQLARKHPFILNARIEPLQWAKMAVRGRLPGYAWGAVLADIKKYTGAGDKVFRQTAAGNIAVDCVNKAWRSPNAPRAAAQGEDKEAMDEEDEAWLDAVNAQAVAKQ